MRKLEFVLVLFLILLATPVALAKTKINVLVNGALLDSQLPPLMQSDRVIVPMRAIFESLGREVTWNSVDRSITSASLWMQIDNPQAVINGTRILLDVPPKLVDGTTYVPVRVVAEGLQASVSWDQENQRVVINRAEAPITPAQIRIGDRADLIVPIMGEPQRKLKSGCGFDWWIFNQDYRQFIQVAVADNTVVAFYTNTAKWQWKQVSFGTPRSDVEQLYGPGLNAIQKNKVNYLLKQDQYLVFDHGQDYVTVFFDTVKGDRATAIRIMRKEYEEKLYEGKQCDLSDEIARSMKIQNFELTNAVRVRENLQPLRWNEQAQDAALAHSSDMATRNFFAHINPDGQSPWDRMERVGLTAYSAAGENIAWGYLDAIFAHEGWMNSPGHRKNILNNEFTELGVGVFLGEKHKNYFTQDFVAF